MGRVKNSPEERHAIMAAYIDAAADMIREDGIESVSIRKVSARAGFSSATLYLYFSGLDELVSLASVSYLRAYVAELSKKEDRMSTPQDAYNLTWEVFCMHTFAHPAIFRHLFFETHGNDLSEIVKSYYSVFPRELDQVSGTMLSMLMSGDLHARNARVLKPYAEQLGLSDEEADLANDMTVSFYHGLLMDACDENMTSSKVKKFTERLLNGSHFILRDK